MELHLIRPEWLFAFIPLAIILLILWRQKSANTDWNRYIPNHLSVLLVEQGEKQKKSLWYWLAFSWIIAVLALTGPAMTKQNLPVFAKNQGRILVMDMSLSMYATDLSPNRLAQARFRAVDLLQGIKEGETGLVAYAGDAFLISPLTQDSATLLNLLPTLSPDIMPVRGSNMASAIKQAQQLLIQGGHLNGDILIFTDGINNQDFDASMALVKNSPYRLGILAIGSEQGAPIKLPDGQLQRDTSNEIVVAKTNYDLLNQLALASQGQLFPAQNDGSDTEALINWLQNEGQSQETELSGETWQDLGPYLALLLLLPALLSFRQGTAFALLLVILLPTPQAQASVWDDLWQTQDQQAMDKFNQGQFSEAAEQFDHQQWQANAHYEAGDFEKALQGFEKDTSAQGYYNQGNALMQQNKFSDAKQRYQQALELDDTLAQAKANKALAEKLEEQQKQEQQGSDQQNSDENNSDKGESGDNNQDGQGQDGDKDKSDKGESSQDKSQEESGDDKRQQNQASQEDAREKQSSGNQSNDSNDQSDDNQMQASSDEQSLKEQEQEKEHQRQQASAESPEQNSPEEQAKAKQTGPQQDPTNSGADETKVEQPVTAQNKPTDLPPDMNRALQAISEDPQVLLRNKMELEYQKRRQRGELTQESQQW